MEYIQKSNSTQARMKVGRNKFAIRNGLKIKKMFVLRSLTINKNDGLEE